MHKQLLTVIIALAHLHTPLQSMDSQYPLHSHHAIEKTLSQLGNGAINLDEAFKALLPPEITNKIVCYAYKDDFDAFFTPARLWFSIVNNVPRGKKKSARL